jgi:hypothetical protein
MENTRQAMERYLALQSQVVTVRQADGRTELLVCRADMDPLRFVGRGAALVGVAPLQGNPYGLPPRTGSALLLRH